MEYQYTGDTPTMYRDKRVLPGETVELVHPSDLQKMDLEKWELVTPIPFFSVDAAGIRYTPQDQPVLMDHTFAPNAFLGNPNDPVWTSEDGKVRAGRIDDTYSAPVIGTTHFTPDAGRETGDLADYDAEAIDEDTGVDVTPRALELAEEHGLDLADVQGSGAGGRILVKDVERLIGGSAAAEAGG